MIVLTLQLNEAEIVERVLDAILTNEAASDLMFKDGAEKRSARRVSKKLHWANGGNNVTQAA